MMPLNAQLRSEIEAHAASEFPREACGLIVVRRGRPVYWPCTNTNTNPENEFQIDEADWARAEDAGSVVSVVHSHPGAPPKPSQADLLGCEQSGLPWHIVSYPGREWESIAPSGYSAPLEGRRFVWGVADCYALIRDWYKEMRCIEFPNYARADKFWERGENLYLDHFKECGFVALPEGAAPIEGDVILMEIRSVPGIPNHGAVCVGDNLIMHHLAGRLSGVEPYLGSYRAMTTHILRRAAC